MTPHELPIPPHFNPEKVGEVWKVAYQERATDAEKWAKEHDLQPASADSFRISLLLVDIQNTFCIPGFELFVGGSTGTGAVDDNRRVCEFIYRNLHQITEICPTMDTHQAVQIFHGIFLVNDRGEHPAPFTQVSVEDVAKGVWRFNPDLASTLGVTSEYGQQHLEHYCRKLKQGGKYDLTIWPYHAMLGGIGHALVSAVEEAVFFHSIARCSQPDFEVKGRNPLTEHYSVLNPEVVVGPQGEKIGEKNERFIRKLLDFDAVVVAGQAKSHCVAWTIDDLLSKINAFDHTLVEKVYLLEDCSSAVVIPGVADYTSQADEAFQKFAAAGMHVVRSTDPIANWPDVRQPISGTSTEK
jgi:nicotinamidase-related amidase